MLEALVFSSAYSLGFFVIDIWCSRFPHIGKEEYIIITYYLGHSRPRFGWSVNAPEAGISEEVPRHHPAFRSEEEGP
jgi:hypothetical protein